MRMDGVFSVVEKNGDVGGIGQDGWKICQSG